MANHPLHLLLRFLLELSALFALGFWGWTQQSGVLRLVWTIGFPLVFAILWGTFRVPDDPGKAPVAVPGIVRLLLELVFFGAAVWSLNAAGQGNWGLVFGIIVLIHYLISYDRLIWLLKR